VKSVLVIDDNAVILKQTKIQLSNYYEVLLANSGRMALQILQIRRPDLILLDVEMPGMNGFELFDKLKELPGLCGVPIIFHSSLTDFKTQLRCFKLGARDYIVKPTFRDVLLYRISLHLQLSEYLAKMEDTVAALSGIMTESFAELINYRYKMSGHSERVPKICSLLGREIVNKNIFLHGFNSDDLTLIIQASPLHDIGNITIPDSILLKPGPLTDDERDIMKNHSAQGAAILNQFSIRIPTQKFYHYARLISLTHHEAWDGSGYPAGLKENDIPLCGRLVAIADVYDDLTSDRVYRSKLNHSEACKTIIEEKSRRFDPKIVEVFETLQDQIEAICA
jgi:putative two-component system response regulator